MKPAPISMAPETPGVPTSAKVSSLQIRREGGNMPTPAQLREANRWGPVGLIVLAVTVLGGAAIIKWGPPTVSVDAPDRYTATDHARFEVSLDKRFDKLDRVIERLDVIVSTQSRQIDRLLLLAESQEARIKSLEGKVR